MANEQIGFDFDSLGSREGALKTAGAAVSAEADEIKTCSPETEEVVEELQVYSVSELNGAIRGVLEGQFPEFWIQGEISNFKAHSSGHWYFSLKDDAAQINAVMFRGLNSKLKFRPESGLEVMVKAKVTVYEPRGNYQLFCQWMEPVGAGALQKAFEQLKDKLAKEGLFSDERKRPLPEFPKHIGVVTSPTGAAIRDILNVLGRRFKAARVTLAPALVQGEGAAASIVGAIELINQLPDLDVLIVGRGGGSIEDLWCFNEEIVARAIVASKVPVISAVGHEVDFTISDFVADLRAPTPSAAAELVVKNASELLESVKTNARRLLQAMKLLLSIRQDRCEALTKRLVDPRRRLQDLIIRCDELTGRLEASALRKFSDHRSIDILQERLRSLVEQKLQRQKSRYRESVGRLEAMSPLKVVERGYSITSLGDQVVKSASQLKAGDLLDLRFAKGQARAQVISCDQSATNKISE